MFHKLSVSAVGWSSGVVLFSTDSAKLFQLFSLGLLHELTHTESECDGKSELKEQVIFLGCSFVVPKMS